MGEKLVVGPISRGLKTNVTPFNIDNDSFPVLINAYQWRGRVKRKRGTSLLTRLVRFFNSGATTIVLNGSGAGNLLTGFSITTLSPNASIVPGTVTITAPGPTVFTDPAKNGTLSPSGTINYATGAIVIAAAAGLAITAQFNYYPTLPVMGLEDLLLIPTQFPGTLAFDTVYSYNITKTFPYTAYDVSFYKNPATGDFPGYIQKTTWTPITWNGQDYQQFWTVNYQGALWATNGVNVPFSITNIGMQFKPITNVVINAAGPPALATLTIVAHGLVQGDFVFINEVNGITGINWQTGYVVSANPQAANTVQVEFPNATLGGAYVSGGIAQYLTNRSDPTKDCIRWYDGDPTNGNLPFPIPATDKGWVNFMPPLSQSAFSIADLPPAIYYLVGAKMIQPFKDRLLFIGAVVQTSVANASPIYLQDTVVYSQNGTPYYTVSYSNSPNAAIDTPTSPTNVFTALLVPDNQTATPSAYFGDSTGFGGFITAGISSPIITSSSNQDVLVLGFATIQSKLVYSGNDIIPFNFFLINSEMGSSSTFSAINMDVGIISKGPRGYIMTTQTNVDRIDLEIPDQVFEVRLIENGNERFCSQRDFINEWIYFTYPSNRFRETVSLFPNETLEYNYRDNSYALFYECYTTYGAFQKQTGFTWQTVGTVYPTWASWTEPWNAGTSTLLQPEVIGGNQQGFVIVRDDGTFEATSLAIQSFSGNTVTCPDHCLNNGDYILIDGAIGTISSQVNNKTFSVFNVTANTFQLNPSIGSGTYSGGALIRRIYVPFIQTKQFPSNWGISKKTRLGPQQYLLTTTDLGQIQLLIYLSQNADDAYNNGPIVPELGSDNNGLIYSTVLYTCTESSNLGLTPANTNLQMISLINPAGTNASSPQSQIWHRVNTSLIGDTVQLGFSLSDSQVRSLIQSAASAVITGATRAYPCVLACTGQFSFNTLIRITDVQGMIQLNNNVYNVLSSTSTHVTIDVDSTGFNAYTSGGVATPVANFNNFAEIELHGFILDINPSQMLA
jgi:hypothetical protein